MVGVNVVELVLVIKDALLVLLLRLLVGLLLDRPAAIGEAHLVDLGLQRRFKGSLGVGVLQQERLNDESSEDVEDQKDADHVEGDEEHSGGLGAGGKDKPIGENVPLVDHQQLQQKHHGAAKVIEVIGTIFESVERRISEVLQIWIWIVAWDPTVSLIRGKQMWFVSVFSKESYPVLERLHPDHGIDVEEDKEDPGIGEEGGEDVEDGVEDALEVVDAVEDLHNPHHPQDQEDVEDDIGILIVPASLVHNVKYERSSDDDKVKDVPEFAEVHVESERVHLEKDLKREDGQKNPFNVVDVGKDHKSVDEDDSVEDVTEVFMFHKTDQLLGIAAVVEIWNVPLEEICSNLGDLDVEQVGEVVELLAVDVTTLVFVEDQPQNPEMMAIGTDKDKDRDNEKQRI